MRGRALAGLTCLLLVLGLLACPAAAVPALPQNGCVLDSAGVLESDTIQHIVEQNQALNQETGATIAVLCVDFLDGKDIADYALETFNTWQLGDSQRNNGLLLLLAIGEDNYYALQGDGLTGALSDSDLGDYTYTYLEEDFAAKRYDAGVRKTFDAFLQWFDDYYAGSPAPGQNVPAQNTPVQSAPTSGGGSAVAIMGAMVVFTVAVFFVVAILIIVFSRRGSRGYGYYYRPYGYHRSWWPLFLFHRHRRYGPPPPMGGIHLPDYHPHTGGSPSSSYHSGGSSRGGGAGRGGGGSSIFRSGASRGTFRSGGSRGSFRSGGMSRGGGAGRR